MNYSRYLGVRLNTLPIEATDNSGNELCSMRTAKRHLKITSATYWAWRRKDGFSKVETAHGGKPHLIIDKLAHWLVHMGAIKPRAERKVNKQIVRENPPRTKSQYKQYRKDAAKKALGL